MSTSWVALLPGYILNVICEGIVFVGHTPILLDSSATDDLFIVTVPHIVNVSRITWVFSGLLWVVASASIRRIRGGLGSASLL